MFNLTRQEPPPRDEPKLPITSAEVTGSDSFRFAVAFEPASYGVPTLIVVHPFGMKSRDGTFSIPRTEAKRLGEALIEMAEQ